MFLYGQHLDQEVQEVHQRSLWQSMRIINVLIGLKHIMRIHQLFVQHIGLASCQQLQHATSYKQVLLIRVPLRCSLLQGCMTKMQGGCQCKVDL